MATIHNSELTKELKEGGKLQQLRDVIPSQLADKVVPVMEVNPKLLRRINLIRRATSQTTIYTTPTDKDFFLVGCSINAVATASGGTTITATPKGDAAVVVAAINYGNSVAVDIVSENIIEMFPIPILLERGTTIVSAKTGTLTSAAYSIFGYLVENINA